MRKHLSAAALLFGAALFPISEARAGVLTFNFDPADTFSGTAPAGSVAATFSDVSGGVQLVITSSLGSGENLDPGKALYFNLNPADDPTSLNFALTANSGFSQAASVQTGVDAFKPDGDGLMDVLFTYAPSTKAFTSGESQTYLITGLAGLQASDFDFTSTCGNGCGSGSHYAAIHVQNTPNGGEGSAFVGATVSTPIAEPASLALFGTGLLGLGLGLTRRRTC